MKLRSKKLIYAALSLTMAATIATSQVIAYANDPASFLDSETVQNVSFDNLTGSIDLSKIVNDNLSNQVIDYGEQEEMRNITGANAIKTVIVSLNTPSIVEVKGDDMSVAEFLDTSAGAKAFKNIKESQNQLLNNIAAAGISYKEVARYSTILNAVAIEVNTAHFNKISNFAGVSMAGVSKTYAAPTAVDQSKIVTNYSKIYGTGIYDSTDYLDEYSGNGISVAILDTGLDYTHEAFSYMPEGDVKFEKSDIAKAIEKLDAYERIPGLSADDVYLSAKVPFAFDYSDNDADVYPSYSQHGVHVAGIVAGKADTYINSDGEQVGGENDGIFDFMGVAPNAQLVICKVFTDDLESEDLGGATTEDIISALNDCVTLGVDIINMSLGTTSGFSNLSISGDAEGEQLRICYENIKKAGCSLIAAAGNEYSSGYGSEFGTNLASNPDSGTVGSPSTFIGSMSVASVNGQEAPYMVANPGENSQYGDSPIYYNESNDANAIPFDFAEEMLDGKTSATFTYLVVPGAGENGDYATARTRIAAIKKANPNEKVIVVVRRGKTNFKDKVQTAKQAGADGIIVYNNVPGTIRMSLSDIREENRIPSASVNMDAGTLLTANPNGAGLRSEGKITIDISNTAGPFMNDYSSWGATPNLGLKPDITSHGGEITSAVSGGYEEMSGTSMATPNLAGLMALVREYVKEYLEENEPGYDSARLTQLCNQIVMSTATILYDEEKLPYSPRKQGAGLATLKNIFTSQAYLATTVSEEDGGTEDYRPKIELGEDESKKGEYSFEFAVTNMGTQTLNFKLVSQFFTEQLATGGLAVAEAAYMLDDVAPVFTVNGAKADTVTVAKGETKIIGVTLKLSNAEKAYIDKSFVNGMYVEGFITLAAQNDGQCDLNLPFMGFYGDWEAAPMLDYNAYEIAAIEQDKSLTDEEKPHESVYATQLFSTYYNGRYGVPMGGYAYVQDEEADQVYVTEEYCAISRFNIYNGATATDNYLTSTGIRALYAGLLRNAELVTYDIYNLDTGEKIYDGVKYRIGKAYANGGSASPALVDLKLDPDTLGLINNGKYSIEFNFYMKEADLENGVTYDNTFATTFYVDYDAPMLESSRIRYYNYKDGNDIKQRVYLDLDIYDNHYPQAVLLCYSNEEYQPGTSLDAIEINLATEYVTPVYNPKRNTTNTVEIEITDIYEKYQNRLYVQLDDYALNHSVYKINFTDSNTNGAEDNFSFVLNDRVTRKQGVSAKDVTYNLTLEKNEMYRVELNCGSANAANYNWYTANGNIIKVRGNEIFGIKPGTATISVVGDGESLLLNVTVVDSNRTLPTPNLTFGVIPDDNNALVKASGNVNVNAGQTFDLEITPDPWYYPLDGLKVEWSTSRPEIATVDQKGTVQTQNTRGSAIINATVTLPNGTTRVASVTLNVQDSFNVSNFILNKYHGTSSVVRIPSDRNIMYIGEEAFEDNDTMETVIIPKTVTEISERAFINCTALKYVYFIEETKEGDQPVKDLAKLNLILADAFQGCTNLELLDLTNVKVITVGARVFAGLENLKEIRYMEKMGIVGDYAFQGCTALTSIDITGLHTAGSNIFEGCTGLEEVITGHYTALSEGMFYGCTALESITINAPRVLGSRHYSFTGMNEDGDTVEFSMGGGAFENCTNLKTVNFSNVSDGKTWSDTEIRIGAYAFSGCTNLTTVNFNDIPVVSIGDYAFRNTGLSTFAVPQNTVLGNNVFQGTNVSLVWGNGYTQDNGAVYSGNTLVLAPATIDSSFAIKSGTTEIAPYAFASSTFEVDTITIPGTVEAIGEGAFYGTNIKSITIPQNITVIPANAFASSTLESIVIPANVKEIGANAFQNCRSLAVVTITDGGTEKIGDYAFSGTAISTITLPESVKEMGSYVFYNCQSLETAHLSSLEVLGDRTFERCSNLTTASFGENATASGNYTFFPGIRFGFNGEQDFYASSLVSVDLGGLTKLGEGMFWACESLTSIDLKNVTEVGMGAFTACTKLATVTGIENLTDIGDLAFAETALKTINLDSAETIGEQAFYNVEANVITIPKAVSIGYQAFAGSLITELKIPATLEKFGAGAFMSSAYLNKVEVEEGNPYFFAENNVLYRIIINAKNPNAETTYELCLYPSNLRQTENEEQLAHYRVKDGTASILGYAFAYVNSGVLYNVTLPYSVKTVGAAAFYGSNIVRVNFESIVAPTLLSEYYDLSTLDPTNINLTVFRSMYYTNFGTEIINFVSEVGNTGTSYLTIAYPSNGTGYNNFVYSLYFSSRISLGELLDDNTRELIRLVDTFDKATVNSWNSLAVNTENTAMVTAFAEQVKEAHRLYNNITSAKQLSYLNEGQNREAKLFEVEEALKSVKARFNIPVRITSARVAESSTHKSQYTVGEVFDLTGLVIVVIYDDYSEETVSDTSKMTLVTTDPLYDFDEFVNVRYNGTTIRVPVTVTGESQEGPETENPEEPEEPKSGCGGCGSMDIGSTLGGMGLVLLTLAGAMLIMRIVRRKANK